MSYTQGWVIKEPRCCGERSVVCGAVRDLATAMARSEFSTAPAPEAI